MNAHAYARAAVSRNLKANKRRAVNIVSRARRILRAHVYCARRKEGRGENTSGVFGQVFVCTAGMLAVPIRLQYRVININNT